MYHIAEYISILEDCSHKKQIIDQINNSNNNNNNNNTGIYIATSPWAQRRFTIIVILKDKKAFELLNNI